MKNLSFQEIILTLQNFWQDYGCAILQPIDSEVGAGTFHPATVLKPLSKGDWNAAYVQLCKRPKDARYSNHPNRAGSYYQFQVILKPSPENIQSLYLDSLKALGIALNKHDIRFVEDDWESPTLGASGLGWEVWCDGMEVSQFTYMQQIGGIELRPIAGEITYGLERIALLIQNIDNFGDMIWSHGIKGKNAVKYSDITFEYEKQSSRYYFEESDINILFNHFNDFYKQSLDLVGKNLPLPAYEFCMKASHAFNLLDARGAISITERAAYIAKVRVLAKSCCTKWQELDC